VAEAALRRDPFIYTCARFVHRLLPRSCGRKGLTLTGYALPELVGTQSEWRRGAVCAGRMQSGKLKTVIANVAFDKDR